MESEVEYLDVMTCQGVDEIDEVREVEGELYSKVSVFQHIVSKHVTDSNNRTSG